MDWTAFEEVAVTSFATQFPLVWLAILNYLESLYERNYDKLYPNSSRIPTIKQKA
jgi:hypothetical protein